MVNTLAVRIPKTIAAAVPFYGRQPRAEDVPRIEAPLLIHYAGLDTRINEGWPAFEKALKASDKKYEATSTRTSITGSTTTRPRATTRRPRSSPGGGRSQFFKKHLA